MKTDQEAVQKVLSATSKSYQKGFNDGLKKGIHNNKYKRDFDKYCYDTGYEAGVSEYCRTQPTNKNYAKSL